MRFIDGHRRATVPIPDGAEIAISEVVVRDVALIESVTSDPVGEAYDGATVDGPRQREPIGGARRLPIVLTAQPFSIESNLGFLRAQ